MWSELSAKQDSVRDESRRDGGVQKVEYGRMTVRRWGEGNKKEKRKREQEEPSEMRAVIKRLASDKYRGISRLLPATGWSHTEGIKGRAGRQRSHIPLFSTQSLVLSSCVFTPLPEGIKVNMLAYPPLPHTGWAFVAFIYDSSPSIHPSLPSSPLSCHPAPLAAQFWIRSSGPVLRQHKSAASPSASLISCA